MATLCPHGLTAAECLICATLASSPAETPRSRPRRPPPSATRQSRGGGAGLVLALVAVLLVGWWFVALVSLIFRLAGLLAISVGSGWLGYRLGVHHGRRTTAD